MTTIVRPDRAAPDVVWTAFQEGCVPTVITRAARIAHVIIGFGESARKTPRPAPGTLGVAGAARDFPAPCRPLIIQSP